MIRTTSFDPAEQLNLIFRKDRNGSKLFRFKGADGSPYSLAGIDLQLNIKSASGLDDIIHLTFGNGLTLGGLSDDELTVVITAEQSAMARDLCFWELYNATSKKTWLCGNAYFISANRPDASTDIEITISLDSEIITIELQEAPTTVANIDGGTP
jgi:hypothetical protein